RVLSLYFFTDPPTTPTSTLSLHDALPISRSRSRSRSFTSFSRQYRPMRSCTHSKYETVTPPAFARMSGMMVTPPSESRRSASGRSEEHTSELQSRGHLVCRLLLEKKNTHQ